jgi:hypothetical protein
MAGVANRAARVPDWKFTTSRREASWATMLKKISLRSVGSVTGRSMLSKKVTKQIGSGRTDVKLSLKFTQSDTPRGFRVG